MDEQIDESLEVLGNSVKQLREQLDNKADVGSFDAQFERIDLTLGQILEVVWHLTETVGSLFGAIDTRLKVIERRLDVGGL